MLLYVIVVRCVVLNVLLVCCVVLIVCFLYVTGFEKSHLPRTIINL